MRCEPCREIDFQTAITRMMEEKGKGLNSGLDYIQRLVLAVTTETDRLFHTMEFTRRFIHCKFPFKSDRHPRLTSMQTVDYQECEAKFLSSISILVSAKNGEHPPKFQERLSLLKDKVDVLVKTGGNCMALSGMPARKCLFCCKSDAI